MLIRILSALIGFPLLLFVVINGGSILKLSIFILTLIAVTEFFNAFSNINIRPVKPIGYLSVLLMAMFTLYPIELKYIMLWFFINIILVLIHNLFKKNSDFISSCITTLGIFYVVYFMYHIIYISELQQYREFVWMVFISAWVTDTSAYFTGYFLGRRKLCPEISPKKTIEGAIGGILGSIVASSAFAYYIYPDLVTACMFLGFIASIISQIGDLAASAIKRHVGIKDYGKIMPGHGGILDRFDSILFTAPTVFYFVLLFLK